MGSLLCCAKCWRWYRVGTDGRLTEVPAPKSRTGTLRFYKRDGGNRSLAVSPSFLKTKRRAWLQGSFREAGRVGISGAMVLWGVVLYLAGLTLYIVYYF
jgi:hypothetical protein